MPLTTRQKQITQIALELIASGGIQNLTIKNIAAQLKITEPAIYRHFSTKAEIITAMLRRFGRQFRVEGFCDKRKNLPDDPGKGIFHAVRTEDICAKLIDSRAGGTGLKLIMKRWHGNSVVLQYNIAPKRLKEKSSF